LNALSQFNRKNASTFERESSFFMLGALRGICEDIITLKFLLQLPKPQRHETVQLLTALALNQSLNSQLKFFEEIRPAQPVLGKQSSSVQIKNLKDQLNSIGTNSGIWRTDGKLPPTEQMARAVGLASLYEYLYRSTSEVVHFNPRVALRHGWGKSATDVKFSTKHFYEYYELFGSFYSVYLFVEFCQALGDQLDLSKRFRENLTELKKNMQALLRWPEIITYEEMNLKNPPAPFRAILLAAATDTVDGKPDMKLVEEAIGLLKRSHGKKRSD
jgi:hypothetical protein